METNTIGLLAVLLSIAVSIILILSACLIASKIENKEKGAQLNPDDMNEDNPCVTPITEQPQPIFEGFLDGKFISTKDGEKLFEIEPKIWWRPINRYILFKLQDDKLVLVTIYNNSKVLSISGCSCTVDAGVGEEARYSKEFNLAYTLTDNIAKIQSVAQQYCDKDTYFQIFPTVSPSPTIKILENKCDENQIFKNICPKCGSVYTYQSQDVTKLETHGFLYCPCCGELNNADDAYVKFMKPYFNNVKKT